MLVMSAAGTGLLSLIAITSGVTGVTLAAGVAVIVCLFTGGAREWFRREDLASPPQPPKS